MILMACSDPEQSELKSAEVYRIGGMEEANPAAEGAKNLPLFRSGSTKSWEFAPKTCCNPGFKAGAGKIQARIRLVAIAVASGGWMDVWWNE